MAVDRGKDGIVHLVRVGVRVRVRVRARVRVRVRVRVGWRNSPALHEHDQHTERARRMLDRREPGLGQHPAACGNEHERHQVDQQQERLEPGRRRAALQSDNIPQRRLR